MSDLTPGLEPRKLEADIETKVQTNREVAEPATPAGSEKPQVQTERNDHVEDNTSAPDQTPKETVNQAESQKDKPIEDFSERAQRRFENLANRAIAAEQRTKQLEETLRRMVDVPAPQVSQDEALAKQFKSYDANLKYPTDPREYEQFVVKRAELSAREAARQEFLQNREQSETNELLRKHPDVADDTMLQGAIAAERMAARNKGLSLTLADAADKVKQKLEKKFTKEQIIKYQKDIEDKNSAYVETTKGASPSRQPEKPADPEKMSLKDKEKWLKDNGMWY